MAKDKIEEQRVQQSKAASHRMQAETRTKKAEEQRVQSNTTEKASEQKVEAAAITTAPTPTFKYRNDFPTIAHQ